MDSQPDRVASLEQRIAELEQRLAAIEAARIEPATPADAAPADGAPAMPPPPPMPTTWGPAPMPAGAAAAAGWATRPEPVGWSAPASGAVVPGPATAAAAASAPAWAGGDTAQAQRPTLRDLEERFAGRALAWVGGIALIAAALFFLSIAFSRGWITEPMRVAIGLGAGSASLALGTVLLARRSPLVGNVLAGVGLGVISISLFAATRLYGLIPPEVGLLASLAAAVVAVIIAIRFDARSIAAYGLVAALIAPPLVGAQPTLLTLAFLAVTLAGTTAISLVRSWRWLPQVAFVLVVPQLGGWLAGDPEPGMAIAALGGFWLVNVVAAAGEEVRLRRDDLRASSAMLVVANAAFLLAGLFLVLDGDLERFRGVAIALAALAHLGVGAWFLARNGLDHLFGNLVAATGVALLTIAAFVQLGASVVPVAWAAEAVALTWLAVERRHRWSALGAVVLGGLAMLHLVAVEYPLEAFLEVPTQLPAPATAVTPALVALGGLLLALALAAVLVPVRSVRSVLAGMGVLLVAYAVLFEAAGPALMAMLVMTALVALLLDRLVASTTADPSFAGVEARLRKPWFASACALLPAVLSLAVLFDTELPAAEFGTVAEVPFLNPAFASLVIVLAGLAGGGVLLATRWVRSTLGGLAILLLAWGLAFQVGGVALVEGLAVLLAAGTILDAWLSTQPARASQPPIPRVPALELAASAGGLVAWLAGLAVAVVVVAPPDRLWVEAGRAPLELGWPLAFLALAATAVVAARLTTVPRAPVLLDTAAAVIVVYGVSVGVIAVFEGQVGGQVATEELAKQAQVALSVTWTAIGAATLVAGIVRRRAEWRHAAFALLGLATAKVALIDLASLDVAYRALVLAGLGLLLLGSAYVVTRARGGRDEPLAEGGAGDP